MAKKPGLHLYNTMTKKTELFKPKDLGKASIYVCGVTPYASSHIGHARAYVAFDVLYRYLKHMDYEVTYVRNVTDVDDKIINKANELGEDALVLSGRFYHEFLEDMADLQCLPPTHQPRVSDHMDQIKNMISQIINNDCAYPVEGGDVYFRVDRSPNYGRLSGRKLEDNRAGERVAVNSRKNNPADFALWKSAKPGEPSWDSPWGRGRPGWHIECSAMSAEYLTHTFDIHGGGIDLIFPHHENEIAQSCAACPDSNVGYWLHNEFVTIKKEKMSKSLGNFVTIREATKKYHPLALRHLLMSTHYRSEVIYSESLLDTESQLVFYMYQTLQDCEDALSCLQNGSLKEKTGSKGQTARITPAAKKRIRNLHADFEKEMSDDLDTPSILTGSLKQAFKCINSSLNKLKEEQTQEQQLSIVLSLSELEKEVKKVLNILGLLSDSTYFEVLKQLKEKALKRADLTQDDILHLIEERASAKKNNDLLRGDRIRRKLTSKGIDLMDVGNETIWRPCVPKPSERETEPSERDSSQ